MRKSDDVLGCDKSMEAVANKLWCVHVVPAVVALTVKKKNLLFGTKHCAKLEMKIIYILKFNE